MAQAKDFYSKSVAEAIRQACAEFGTSQEKLDIEVLETGSAGIFGLCRKRAHIRVSKKKIVETEPQAVREKESLPADVGAGEAAGETAAQPAGEAEGQGEADRGRPKKERKKGPRPEKTPGRDRVEKSELVEQETEHFEPPSTEVLEAVRQEVARLLELMGFESEVTVGFAEGSVQCRISGAHEEAIIGADGRTIDSLQYLLRKMMSSLLPDRMSIDLDAGNFRERRVEELKKIAQELAEQVKADGKTQSIPALNPSERRVVHVALQDEKNVRSRSVGDGLFKKVLIYKPGKARKTGPRRRGRQGGGPAEE